MDEVDEKKPFRVSKKILAGTGGGLMAFTTAVYAYIDSKFNDMNGRIDEKMVNAKQYVDDRHSLVESKLEDIEKVLIRIDDRVYEITKNQKGY